MAIYVELRNNNTPHGLVEAIGRKMAAGEIRTWRVDAAGDYTHTAPQWEEEAWLRVVNDGQGQLVLGLVGRRDRRMTTQVYAVYHGRFVEMLLEHFDEMISEVRATSLPVHGVDAFLTLQGGV